MQAADQVLAMGRMTGFGLNKDLDEVMKDAVRKSITSMTEVTPLNGQEALQFGSAAIDFEVTQVVDIVKGIPE